MPLIKILCSNLQGGPTEDKITVGRRLPLRTRLPTSKPTKTSKPTRAGRSTKIGTKTNLHRFHLTNHFKQIINSTNLKQKAAKLVTNTPTKLVTNITKKEVTNIPTKLVTNITKKEVINILTKYNDLYPLLFTFYTRLSHLRRLVIMLVSVCKGRTAYKMLTHPCCGG